MGENYTFDYSNSDHSYRDFRPTQSKSREVKRQNGFSLRIKPNPEWDANYRYLIRSNLGAIFKEGNYDTVTIKKGKNTSILNIKENSISSFEELNVKIFEDSDGLEIIGEDFQIRRIQMLAQKLSKIGFSVELKPVIYKKNQNYSSPESPSSLPYEDGGDRDGDFIRGESVSGRRKNEVIYRYGSDKNARGGNSKPRQKNYRRGPTVS